MYKADLLVLKNKTSLKNTKEFFSNNNIDCFYQEISNSKNIDIDLPKIKTDIVLITSQNAIDVVNSNKNNLDFNKVYCLNSSIQEKIKVEKSVSLNWINTKELAQYIIKNEKPGVEITHLCADNANKIFYKELESKGFKIKAINVYKTTFINNFSTSIINELKEDRIKYIMVFSKASLIATKNIFIKNNLNLKNYKLICFSKNIAAGESKIFSKKSTLKDMLKIYKEQNNG